MERRRALKILGAASSVPVFAPSAALREAIEFGGRVRAQLDSGAPLQQTLTPAQRRSVAAMAEVIIPETDTPGAGEAGVVEFVDALVTGWLDADEVDRFTAGLEATDARARDAFGAAFADATAEQQEQIVSELDGELDRLRRSGDGSESDTFFYDMRRFTLAGFFTSRVGLQALGYRIIPGAFEGCVLLDQYGTGGRR